MSNGYREYKSEKDAYKNDIVALVFVPLGAKLEQERRSNNTRSRAQLSNIKTSYGSSGTIEIATFYVDSHWIGISSEYVVEAIDAKDITKVPGAVENAVGYIMFRNILVPIVGLWGMLGQNDRRRTSYEPQIVILELAPEILLGIMVDELGEIPEIHTSYIEKITGMMAGDNLLTESLVKPDEEKGRKDMIVVISPERLRRKFLGCSE